MKDKDTLKPLYIWLSCTHARGDSYEEAFQEALTKKPEIANLTWKGVPLGHYEATNSFYNQTYNFIPNGKFSEFVFEAQ
jgi:hypothetical protein